MWTLIRCECLRFRKWALGAAALHLLLLGYLYIGGALRPSDSDIANSAAILYTLLGLSFGLVQIGGYRRPSQWVFLMHRPLAPARIWLSLVCAAALLILFTIVAPLYLIILGLDLGSAQYLDLRLYMLPLYLFGLVFACYLCGTFILLSASRAALFVLVLPALFVTKEAGLWIFLPQLAVIGLLLWLNRCAFKPDRLTKPKSPSALLPKVLAIQWGLYYGLFAVFSLTYQFSQMALRQHPLSNPEPDTPYSVLAMDDTAALQYAFGSDADPVLLRELAIADIHSAAVQWNHFPFHQQLPFADHSGFLLDKTRNVEWRFSHDKMLFKGVNRRSGADAGWMGISGAAYPSPENVAAEEHFRAIPHVVDATSLVTPHALYTVDFDNRRLELRHALGDGEEYRSGLQLDGKMAALFSDHTLYFFDAFDVQHGHGLLPVDAAVPLPGRNENLYWVNVAELADGFALSFFYGTYNREGWEPAYLVSGLLPLGGNFSVVKKRDLRPSFSDRFSYKEYLISPLWPYLSKAVWSTIEPRDEDSVSLQRIATRPLPSGVRFGMLICALASALLTALLARRTALSARSRTLWILCNALTGLPGLLSFLFLTDRQSAPVETAAQTVREVQPA